MIAYEGFPLDEDTRAPLYWLGDDYPSAIGHDISDQLAHDDPHGRMLALRCLESPKLEIEASEEDGRVLGVRATFQLHIVMQSPDGSRWRLRAESTYTATNLEKKDGGSISAELNLLETGPEP